jgi:membrane protein DedA with SNARE-associated domain
MNSKIFLAFLFICITRAIGFAFMPPLLNFSPLALIILSPFLHHLILASTITPTLPFVCTGIAISIFQCSIGYEFGRRHGVRATEWCEAQGLVSKRKVDSLTGWLRMSATLILIIIPGPIVAMLAGVGELNRRLFFSVMIPTQIIWVLTCYFLGLELEVFLKIGKNLIQENWIMLTLALIATKLILSLRKTYN